MPLVPTRELVRPGHGIGAFNVITLEHAEAIVAGAASVDRPVILQISENAVAFHGGRLAPIAASAAAVAAAAPVGVALHLDHVESVPLAARTALPRCRRTPPEPAPIRARRRGTSPRPGWTGSRSRSAPRTR